MKKAEKKGLYTCNEYREEMILLSLQKRLASPDLTADEKNSLLTEIARVEKQMGID